MIIALGETYRKRYDLRDDLFDAPTPEPAPDGG
jgi:hypothetical protein